MKDALILTQSHPSFYKDQIYAYPVLSRRANGFSIGINLSQSRCCNFRCIYCQIETSRNRSKEPESDDRSGPTIDLDRLKSELRRTAVSIVEGTLFKDDYFRTVPDEKRILRDFAFSGDGEPTLSPYFAKAVERVIAVRNELKLGNVKLVLITNSTRLNVPELLPVLDSFVANGGEIWAKLDAGTARHYSEMNRSRVPFEQIVDNITQAAHRWPVAVQTMLLNRNGNSPDESEMEEYCRIVSKIVQSGGLIRELQIYTVARRPAESNVTALTDEQIDFWSNRLRERLALPVRTFYSR